MSTLLISIIVSVIIILFILVIFVVAISKGYSYKHTVDNLEENPYLQEKKEKSRDA
ncbi:YtzI protein [Fictibacillus sp. KIGAM418]|uniref:YtzI protein n=1 Tax=Fictibacillus marinisediminis TaxID=2878389 RepID=A0A9X2BBL0_9BACL|nr:YtzI protein [Fictibacillus marinisediminis]